MSQTETLPKPCHGTALEAAAAYTRRGWRVVPVPYRSKNPGYKEWEQTRLDEEDLPHRFNGRPQNIGLLLGEPSGGLNDVDMDCPEAIRIAPRFLPPTAFIFGRKSAPNSHACYIAAPEVETTKFYDIAPNDGKRRTQAKMLIELRSTGAHTVAPGSTHKETGERIEFRPGTLGLPTPSTIEGPYLLALVSKIAAGCILARHWPSIGGRHDAALALAGGLTRAGWAQEDVAAFIRAVAEAANDEEVEDRVKAAETSVDRLASGGKATGWPSLAELVGSDVVSRATEWLGVDRVAADNQEIGSALQRTKNEPRAEADEGEDRVLDPKDPLQIAKRIRSERYSHVDGSTLVYSDGSFHHWSTSRWDGLPADALRSVIYNYTEPAKKWVTRGKSVELVDFQPTKSNVDNIVDAIKGTAFVEAKAPCWLAPSSNAENPREIIAAKNCLLQLRADGAPVVLSKPTPLFFSPNALDYDYDPAAVAPQTWLRFLETIFPDDRQSIELLQEFFGYVLTLDTSLQKMLLIVGPPRSGKGTIARVLTAVIGEANVCGPTLSGLATNFGLWSLIGKQLAIISDARLSGRTDQAVVTERLLSVSGEDAITVDRKNLLPLTTRLLVRFLILTNELPRLTDASGALANRFLILTLDKSFLGREDIGLTERLLKELPGILLWAVEGWKRLKRRGHFVQPDTGADAMEEMKELASPIATFLREWCAVEAGHQISAQDLFEAWQLWCAEQGRENPGSAQLFGRDLRSAMPAITMSRPRTDSGRTRLYEGVELTYRARETLSFARNARAEREKRGWIHG